MRAILYCQSLQTVVQTVVGAGGVSSPQKSFSINLQNHNGNGQPIDPNLPSASAGFTLIADERPDFDAGDFVQVEVGKYVAPAPAEAPAKSE